MDLPIFIGNTYCLFVAKVLDLNGNIDNFKHMFYNMSYTLEKGLADLKAYMKEQFRNEKF